MTFNDYQQAAHATAIYPEHYALTYPVIGLAGEVGELCNKVKKILRDKEGIPGPEQQAAISAELGDCLWYIAEVATQFGLSLDKVAAANVDKLNSRKQRGKLQGSGDER